MSWMTWQEALEEEPAAASPPSAPAHLGEVAELIPELKRLMEERRRLEFQLDALAARPIHDDTPSPRLSVPGPPSWRERREDEERDRGRRQLAELRLARSRHEDRRRETEDDERRSERVHAMVRARWEALRAAELAAARVERRATEPQRVPAPGKPLVTWERRRVDASDEAKAKAASARREALRARLLEARAQVRLEQRREERRAEALRAEPGQHRGPRRPKKP